MVRSEVLKTMRHSAEGPEILSPIAIPLPASRLAGQANRILLRSQVMRRLKAMDVKRPILWVSLPTAVVVAGALGERALVYYCGDDFGALQGVDCAPVLQLERELVQKADLVLAASDVLAQRFPRHKTRLLPHGVDVELFARPASSPDDLPSNRPVAGYYGVLGNWFDVEALAAAARELPEWAFLLIGPVETDVSALSSLANVYLLGPRRYETLPGYVQNWTVSLIPFRDTAWTRAMNPLKLREYLAAGRPIVATSLPALAPYLDLVHVYYDAPSLVAAIRSAALNPDDTARRRARVASETWESRANEVREAIDAL